MNSKLQFINSRIHEGKTVSNWKELCSLLDEPYKTQTHSKDAQRKDWNQYFEFEKVKGKHNLIITKIYEKPRPNFSQKGGSFPPIIDPEVFSVLTCGDYITTNEIAKKMLIVPDDIIDFFKKDGNSKRKITKRYEEFIGIERLLKDNEERIKKYRKLDTFVSITRDLLKSRIKGSMDRLKRKHLIDYEYGYIIKFNSDFFDKIYDKIANENYKELKNTTFPFLYEEITENLSFDDNNSLKVNLQELLYSLDVGNKHPRLANDLENIFLEEVYKKYYKEHEVEDQKELYAKYSKEHDKIHEFYDVINEELDKKYGITVFKGYYIKQTEDVDIIRDEISNINNEFVNELLEAREDSLQKKESVDLDRTKDMRLLIAPLQEKVNKRKEKTENYYYSFDSWANEFLKQN